MFDLEHVATCGSWSWYSGRDVLDGEFVQIRETDELMQLSRADLGLVAANGVSSVEAHHREEGRLQPARRWRLLSCSLGSPFRDNRVAECV